ncbi:hypothetical protein [Peredibacter starrii]|uniref:Clostripain n=1 Tax=Peredibacter starrii TaxID=28202 RepID=A0AAX4HNL9_9BACT|nr:hypothetical protein [Peredibacter starrii]WPU64867.1 hypothetical protein SOO65_19415 [Peredibacter starrii]
MKKLLLLPLAVLPLYAGASCQDSIKSDKYMLFIDTNESEREIETAEKAACARGEKMVIVPKNYKDYRTYMEEMAKAKKVAMDCTKKNPTSTTACRDVQVAFRQSYEKMEKFRLSQPKIETGTDEALKEIKSKNGKLNNLIISGHDGGGEFGGAKGRMSREDLSKAMAKYKDINNVSTLMLLGCYTGVQKEIIEWKNIFPDVRMIGGYDDSAPLSDKPAGHQFITELLTKEKALIANADQKKLQNFTRANVKSLTLLNAAVYVNCEDGTNKEEFYYTSKNRGKHFSPYGAKECHEKEKEFNDIITQMAPYETGEKEPPADTARGELRQLYIKARNLEHCSDFLKKEINVSNLFNLLFYQGIKDSFAAFYKDDLAAAEKAVEEMKKKYPNYLKDIWVPTAENLAKHSRKEMLENIHNIHGILSKADLSREEKKVLRWTGHVSSRHLHEFGNPFSWHEYTSGTPEAPRYPLRLANYSPMQASLHGGYGFASGIVAGSGSGALSTPAPQREESDGTFTRLLNFIRE